jgi:hypothetical protein
MPRPLRRPAQEIFADILNGARLGLPVATIARTAGVDRSTVDKLFEAPPPAHWRLDERRSVRQILADEQRRARLDRLEESEKIQLDGREQRVREAQLAQASSLLAVSNFKSLLAMKPAMDVLAVQLAVQIQAGAVADPVIAMRLIASYSRIAARTVDVGRAALEVERVRTGAPSETLTIEVGVAQPPISLLEAKFAAEATLEDIAVLQRLESGEQAPSLLDTPVGRPAPPGLHGHGHGQLADSNHDDHVVGVPFRPPR